MPSSSTKVTSINAPVLVELKTHGDSSSDYVRFIPKDGPTFYCSRVHQVPKGGVIFLPSSASSTRVFLVRMLATLMSGTVYTVKGLGSTQSSATAISTNLWQSSATTVPHAQPKKRGSPDV